MIYNTNEIYTLLYTEFTYVSGIDNYIKCYALYNVTSFTMSIAKFSKFK